MTNEIQVANTDYEMMWKISQRVSATPFVPKGLQGKNESVLACILYGAELGLGPMQSLNSIHVIEGRTAMSPELMRAMVARHGHRIDVIENTNTACELKGVRADTGSTASVRWTLEDAKLANLTNKDNWKKYPRAMLLARATSELCRIVFPDVVAGLSYTPEEVASIEGVDFEVQEISPEPVIVDEDIVDAEIVEETETIVKSTIAEEQKQKTSIPKQFEEKQPPKFSQYTKKVAEDLENKEPNPNFLTFEQRIAICESWGRWPYVKAVCSVQSKKLNRDMPISFYELAHDEVLFEAVKKSIEAKM